MRFPQLNAPTLKELFVQEIENMILSGVLRTGERLPPERELAEAMRVSRSIVNAGINEMAAKGFLEIHPRVGVFVGDYRRHGTPETLVSIMKYNGGSLRREEIRSILELKVVEDKLAVSLLIPKVRPEDTAVLREHLSVMEKAETPEEAAMAGYGFYHTMALLSGNTLLPLQYSSFKLPIFSLWERFSRKHGVGAMPRNAAALLDAIEAGDLERAYQVIEAAVGSAMSEVDGIYEE